VLVGSGLNPATNEQEFATSARREFNFCFDPQAAWTARRAHWPRVDVTVVDVSIKTMVTQPMLGGIAKLPTRAARYVAASSTERYCRGDALAACAWLDPSIISTVRELCMSVDVSRSPS
jgi:inosine-uridine nucleoside N-ribohydrolase